MRRTAPARRRRRQAARSPAPAPARSARPARALAEQRDQQHRTASDLRGQAGRRRSRGEDGCPVQTVRGAIGRLQQAAGGNAQKVVLARAFQLTPKALLLDEPTRGVDIGARSDIYAFLGDLAARGTAILLASSDLLELLGVADRIVVLAEDRVAGELDRTRRRKRRSRCSSWAEGTTMTMPDQVGATARAPVPPPGRRPRPTAAARTAARTTSQYIGVLSVLVIVVAVLWANQSGFMTAENWINIAELNAELMLVAIGLTFVLLTEGIDLSVGAMWSFAGIACGSCSSSCRSPWP